MYGDLARTVCIYSGSNANLCPTTNWTSLGAVALVIDALPIRAAAHLSGVSSALQAIERTFTSSPSDLAKILHVTRQMIYHYRSGMEPAVEKSRRVRLIAELADYTAMLTHSSLEPILKLPQPGGSTLLNLLSKESPDVPQLRRILARVSEDLEKRKKVAASLGYATPHDRQDIMRDRHAQGKPIYVTDPQAPDKIVQIRPDQTRVRGHMVNRVFVPDEE